VNPLAPLALAYGGAAALRAELYRRGWLPRARLSGPVISVGNLSLGGSGKTPLVARVAELLRDHGLPVAVLSRGYGGRFRGTALIVSDGRATLASAAEAGDEPAMLAAMLPGVVVAVGPRRDAVGRVVEARFGRRVHVLDDGFQHLRLERDLDLLCLDAADADERTLPAGRLREFPRAAARADVVLLAQGERPESERLAALTARFGAERLFRVRRRVLGFFDLAGTERPAPARPFLVSAIARPERFEADAAARVERLAGQARFRDHHFFAAGEWLRLLQHARAAGADAVVTTAKDAVRLPVDAAEPPVLVLRIQACVDDEPRFRARLLAAAERAA
jgi:tetraacyldisaccharide 4'-kinase